MLLKSSINIKFLSSTPQCYTTQTRHTDLLLVWCGLEGWVHVHGSCHSDWAFHPHWGIHRCCNSRLNAQYVNTEQDDPKPGTTGTAKKKKGFQILNAKSSFINLADFRMPSQWQIVQQGYKSQNHISFQMRQRIWGWNSKHCFKKGIVQYLYFNQPWLVCHPAPQLSL